MRIILRKFAAVRSELIFPQTATSNLQTPTLTQVITVKLLEAWGYDAFIAHTHSVSAFYREKRDIFERALNNHLAGLAEWSTPEAGMFFW